MPVSHFGETELERSICPKCCEDQIPFSLTCWHCEAGDGIATKAQAIACGWKDIVFDDGGSWNFIGTCPECSKAEQEDA